MNTSKLYEDMPHNELPVHFVLYPEMGVHKFPSHWHEHLEIHYVFEGTTSVWCEGKLTEIKAGECLVINSNELHEGIGGESKHLCIIISPSVMGTVNVIYNNVIADKSLNELAEKLLFEYTNPDKSSNIAIMGYVNLIIAHLNRNHVFKEYDKAGYSAYSRKTATLNKVVTYLDENFYQEISLQDVAKLANVNKSYLCNIFHEYTGKTIKEYINELRVEKAKGLLLNTDMPITEISYVCGFNDSNYFARKFRQITGLTPSKTRKTALK